MPSQGIDIDMLGDKELARDFAALPFKVQKKLFRKSLRPGAKIVQARAKELVPVKTGRLKRSLKIRATRRARRVLGVQVLTGTREQLGISPDAKGYYPAALEYGYKTASGKVVPKRSYLRRAADEKKELVIRKISTGLSSLVGEAMRGT